MIKVSNADSTLTDLDSLLTLSGPAVSVIHLAWGGVTGPDAKNQGYHNPMTMKLCMGLKRHKSIPDAKFECGSFPIFGDITSQNFPLKKGTNHRIRVFTPGK